MKKMFKKKESLNKREEELMNYLWEIKKPMTTNEMAKQLQSEGWTNITLCRTVQSLTDQGYLEVAGLEKSAKTYARKLIPSLSKEEYYSSVLMNRGINANSLADLTAALIGASRKKSQRKGCGGDSQARRSDCFPQGRLIHADHIFFYLDDGLLEQYSDRDVLCAADEIETDRSMQRVRRDCFIFVLHDTNAHSG